MLVKNAVLGLLIVLLLPMWIACGSDDDNGGATNLCNNVDCYENATCDNGTGGCVCNTGYENWVDGTGCSAIADLCADVDCYANATCDSTTGNCVCDTGYENWVDGTGCSEVTDLCADVDCYANATCDDTTGNCVCNAGYEDWVDGTGCSEIPDLCTDVDCYANATCDDSTGDCVCDDGYENWVDGAGCSEIPDLCENVDCYDHATCDSTTGDCVCDDGYENWVDGTGCSEIPDLCENVDCYDHATCDDTTGDCVCDDGYENWVDGTGCAMIPLTTERDDKGVWFIEGSVDETVENVFEAMGYAVATDRLWQAETYRRTASGRLAEIFGPSQLETDVFIRSIGYTDEELDTIFDAMGDEEKALILAYVAGFNRRIAEIRNDTTLLPFEFTAIGQALSIQFGPEDWTKYDVLRWMSTLQRNFDPEALKQGQLDNATLYQKLYIMHGDTAGPAMFQDLRWINDPQALTYIHAEDSTVANYGPLRVNLPDMSIAARAIKQRRNNAVENLKKINAYVKMGSYAWTVSGDKTESGNPIIYSGPQMGFTVPSITLEGSIRAAGIEVSGMSIAGIPGIVIGRTPHHAWSMQVGHAHTTDFYIETPTNVTLHHLATIKVAGQEDVTLPVYRTTHGPLVNPIPYDPNNYDANTQGPLVAWKYAHWGAYEFQAVSAWLALARAQNMDEFGAAVEKMGVSQHFCYADNDGNIAYWMSGRDPQRPDGEWRFPQPADNPLEWDAAVLRERATDRNTTQGYYGGWNNKAEANYPSSFNNLDYFFGPFHRAHVIDEYLSTHDDLTFEEIRDLALDIATTDSFGKGGNPWPWVATKFADVVNASTTTERAAALALIESWDGHFVDGGAANWASGTDRADAWILTQKWIDKVLSLTFDDELGPDHGESKMRLFNVLLHLLDESGEGIAILYPNWFANADTSAPQTIEDIILQALDATLVELGTQPWGTDARGTIEYKHDLLTDTLHETPFSSRSTYAHCVEMGEYGPVRIESMFPLGESGHISLEIIGDTPTPVPSDHFFDMAPVFDAFAPRDFPLFD